MDTSSGTALQDPAAPANPAPRGPKAGQYELYVGVDFAINQLPADTAKRLGLDPSSPGKVTALFQTSPLWDENPPAGDDGKPGRVTSTSVKTGIRENGVDDVQYVAVRVVTKGSLSTTSKRKFQSA